MGGDCLREMVAHGGSTVVRYSRIVTLNLA